MKSEIHIYLEDVTVSVEGDHTTPGMLAKEARTIIEELSGEDFEDVVRYQPECNECGGTFR